MKLCNSPFLQISIELGWASQLFVLNLCMCTKKAKWSHCCIVLPEVLWLRAMLLWDTCEGTEVSQVPRFLGSLLRCQISEDPSCSRIRILHLVWCEGSIFKGANICFSPNVLLATNVFVGQCRNQLCHVISLCGAVVLLRDNFDNRGKELDVVVLVQ